MKRFAGLLVLIAAVGLPGSGVFAQTPAPYRSPMSKLRNPAHDHRVNSMNGQGCIAKAAGTQQINPITGKAQATTIVSIPVSGGSGNIPANTTRHQQAAACGHAVH